MLRSLMRALSAPPRVIALAALLIASVVIALALLMVGPGRPEVGSVNKPPDLSSAAPSTAGSDICADPDRTRGFVSEFITAYNDGQAGLADRFFAPVPAFQWYSEQPRREGAAAYDRSTLEAYLNQRHADGDRLTLVSVQLNFVGGGVASFGFVLARGGTQLPSKGALDCSTRRFIVFSIGPNPGPVP
jgi:hypothetical protein